MQMKPCAAVLLVWLTSVALLEVSAQTADTIPSGQVAIAVVVNPKNSIVNLRSTDLRQIFAGEKRSWPDGQVIKLFVRAPHAPERDALLGLLRMTETEYKTYWSQQVFRGDAQVEPVALFSNGMQKEGVIAYPGAIALVSVKDVKQGVKVVKVDGRLPSDPGYRLH